MFLTGGLVLRTDATTQWAPTLLAHDPNPPLTLGADQGVWGATIPDPPTVSPNSAVAYWPLDEGAGSSIAHDVIGTRNGTLGTGTTCGVAGVTAGPTAMQFDGTPACQMPIPPLPTLYPAFSYEAWIAVTAWGTGSLILTRNPSQVGGIRWWTSTAAPIGNQTATIYDGVANRITQSPVSRAIDAWAHVVVTHNGATCRVYENGVLTTGGSNPFNYALGVSDVATLQSFIACDAGQNYRLTGKLQDIAVYTRALSAQEVSDHYALRLTGDMTAYRNAIQDVSPPPVQAFAPSIVLGGSPPPQAITGNTITSTTALTVPTVAGAVPGFTHYSSVTVNSGQVPSTQTDFPMLVSITDTRFKTVANGGHVQNASGFDLRPYDTPGVTGGTALTFQLERYNPTTGDVAMWVKVPSLAVGTMIYLRYGYAALTTDGSSTATWDSHFKGVWHFGSTSLDLSDATANGNGLANSGAVAATGIYGGVAAYLSGGAGGPLLTRSLSPVQVMPVHVSMWLKSPSPGGITWSSLSAQVSNWDGWYASYDSTGQASNNSFVSGAAGPGWVAGAWNYVTYQFISSTLRRTYVNGVAGADDTSGPNTPTFLNFQFCLGAAMHGGGTIDNYGNATYYDEVRISDIARSADWVFTEYNNQNAPGTFATLGTEIGAGGVAAVFRASTLQVFAPVVDGGPNLVTTATVASTLQVFIPIVVNVTAGFTYYLPFTVQAGMVPSTQTDFAVLVSLTDARLKTLVNGGHVQNNFGYDIRPYAGIGTGVTLSYELEFYDSTVGKLVMWVKVPSLAVGTVIYLYYGDPTITTDGSSTATWDSAFRGVWHTNVTVGGTFSDATGNGNYLINLGGALALGQIAGGVNTTDPSGTDPFGFYLRSNDPGIFDYTSSPFTLSCWLKPTSLSNASNLQCFVFKGSASQDGYYGWINNNGAVGFTTNQTSTAQSSNAPTGSAAVGVWVFIAIVRSGNSVRIFINGVDATQSAGFHQNPVQSNWYFDWGSYNNGVPAYGAPGVYDEPRVSVTARSANWILTEYKNQFTPTTFITPGTEVPLGGGGGGDQTVSGVFIASTVQLFAPVVAAGVVAVTTPGRPTTIQVFVPIVAPGAVTVTTPAFVTTIQVFAPTVAPGAVSVTTVVRSTTIQVFAPSVAPGAVSITGATIASTGQVFAPTIAAGAVTVVTPGRVTTIQVFAPTVQALVSGATIPSGSALFAPLVVQNITTASRATTIQVFLPTVVLPAVQPVTAGTITTGVVMRVPTVTVGPVTVLAATLVPAAQVFLPTVALAGVQNVTLVHRATTAVLNVPVLTVGSVTVVTVPRASTLQMFLPIVSPAGVVNIGGGTVATTVQVFALTVAPQATTITTGTRPTTVQMFAPSVTALVSGATIVSGSALFAPKVVQTITTAFRGAITVLFPPIVLPTGALGGPTALSTLQMFAPTVSSAAVGVGGAHIGSMQSIAVPSVTTLTFVVTAPLSSVTQVFVPRIDRAGLTIGFISSTAAVFGPDVLAQLRVVVGGLVSTARVFPPSLGGFPAGTCATSGITIRSLVTSATMTHAVVAQGSVQVRYLSTATMASLGSVMYGSVQVRSRVVSDGVQGGCCKEALVL